MTGRRVRAQLATRGRRLAAAALPILQCALAAGLAWWVASDLVGHQQPFFAPIAAILSLGVALGNRLRRVAELVVGVSVGILVGDVIISWIGTGGWQIAVVVALAMTVAVLADSGALLVAQAGASAVLVATLLPPGDAGAFDRWIDALIGGAVGLAVVAVVPTDPVGPVRRDARAVLDELSAVLLGIADALRERDDEAAAAALRRARASQPLIDELRAALHGGREATAVSPLLRRRRRLLGRFAELAERSDYAMRNARVLARRCYAALCDDEPAVAELTDLLTALGTAVSRLTAEVGRDGDRERARQPILEVAHDAAALDPAGLGASEQVLLAQTRSIVVDLLQATGMTRTEAIEALRARLPDPGAPDSGPAP